MPFRFVRYAWVMLLVFPVLGSGCRGEIIWPFGVDGQGEFKVSSNEYEYHCAENKQFHLRYLANGDAVWISLPEREVRLDKRISVFGDRYTNGKTTLILNGQEAVIEDEAMFLFKDCKIVNRS